VLALAARWRRESSTPARAKLIEHALRSLVKAGDARALKLLGAAAGQVAVTRSVSPSRVRLGEHYARPTGTAVKTFRLARVDLGPRASATAIKRLTLVHVSIRRLHEGVHRVEVQANGARVAAGQFTLSI
jgi:hypothetical protein